MRGGKGGQKGGKRGELAPAIAKTTMKKPSNAKTFPSMLAEAKMASTRACRGAHNHKRGGRGRPRRKKRPSCRGRLECSAAAVAAGEASTTRGTPCFLPGGRRATRPRPRRNPSRSNPNGGRPTLGARESPTQNHCQRREGTPWGGKSCPRCPTRRGVGGQVGRLGQDFHDELEREGDCRHILDYGNNPILVAVAGGGREPQ